MAFHRPYSFGMQQTEDKAGCEAGDEHTSAKAQSDQADSQEHDAISLLSSEPRHRSLMVVAERRAGVRVRKLSSEFSHPER